MAKEKLKKEDVLSKADIVSIVGRRVALKRKGKELLGLCPFHKEKNPSFTVDRRGFFKCFGCGEGGDAADFIMKYERCDFPKALEIINEDAGGALVPAANIPPPPPPDPQIIPVPDWAPQPSFVHSRWGNPTTVYTYANEQGKTIGHVCRFDPPGEKKQLLPLSFRARDGWRWMGFDFPRPLYGLDMLAANPEATVFVVEGEKTAELCQRHLPKAVVVCWYGGTNAVEKADWRPLFGRKHVIFWPDNDFSHTYGDKHPKAGQIKPWYEQPGNKAMLQIAEIVKPHVESVWWIENPPDVPCGWDPADKEWAPGELRDYAVKHRTPVPVVEPEPEPTAPEPPKPDDLPFTPLGFKKEGDAPKYCFFAGTSKTMVYLSASSMNKQSLMNLAPLNWWESYYPAGKGSRNSFDVDAASQFLIAKCLERGIFSESRIRGRGAWLDEGRTVLHAGDRLIVDGKETQLSAIRSKYIYEQGFPLDFAIDDPLDTYTASKFITMMQTISWARPVNAYLLAGWCVIAPVCGALPWRPHLWVTGSAGTGKTWISKFIVAPMLGESGIIFEGDTTAPGIRGVLGNDSLPVVYDEAEGEHQSAQERMRSVLELVRIASASDSGIVAKGSAGGGKANTTRLRSSFLFLSIAFQASQQSDRSRITLLELRKLPSQSEREKAFNDLLNIHAELMSDEFVRGIHARTIKLLPTIVHNSDVFNRAAAAVLGEKRHGDQLGPLLAGAYSLCSEEKVTFEIAKEFVAAQDWNDEVSLSGTRDELRLFSHLMEQIIEVESDVSRYKRTVGELCQIARSGVNYAQYPSTMVEVSAERADATLRRHGIKVENEAIVISNQHDGIKRLLAKTPWAGGNHGKILIRIDGAEKIAATTFSRGVMKSNAVAVPITMLD